MKEPEELLRWCAEQLLLEPYNDDEQALAKVFTAAAEAYRAQMDGWPYPRKRQDWTLVDAVVGFGRQIEKWDDASGAPLPGKYERVRGPVDGDDDYYGRDDGDHYESDGSSDVVVLSFGYEREDPATGGPLPEGVDWFAPGGAA